ncbi:MAG: proprotein convertase P-domain-containing protein, partial [Candidatus Thermoplasmatota archaeon]
EKVSGEFEIDSTPPGKVNDLSVSSVTYNSITLTWSAPGEDGEVCNITHTKDEDNLTIPDGVGNVTSNLSVPENIMIGYIRVYLRINHTYVMNLVVKLSHPDGTTVTLFNHTGGSDDNIWGWYEDNTFTSEPGSSFNLIPSESISALKTKGSQGIWKLYVADTSAGQTGAIDYWKLEIKAGKVISYELRYNSTSEITEANWENSTLCANIILPSVPGTIEKFEVTGLSPGIKYHIGVRSTDNVGWQSVLSNVVNSTTPLYVEVLTPNGNQCWSGESNHKIEYKFLGSRPSDKVYDHYIYYVYNGNVEFLVHYYSEANGTFEVSWTTTKIDSTKVKVRVNITVEGYSYGEDESDSNFTIDSTPPTVINATSNVSILPDTPIIIEFSEPMNRSSVESAFSSSPLFASISWAWNANFTIATISHADFTTGTYNCKINTSAKDVSDPGNSLPQNYTFSFKVVYPLEVYVMYPNGGEVWNGSLNWNIVYTISGGSPPYNVSLYWVNGSVEGYIATESRSLAGSHAYQWVAPGITNNTLKIKVEVVDNTTPKQLKSDLSDEVFEIDSTPPGKALLKDFGPNLILEPDIIAKEGYPRAHAVKIKWLAPGDDGDIGKVKYYHIKYSNNSIDDNSWGNIISYINYTARVSAGEWE